MAQWFRMYETLLDDPKVQRLRPDLFKTWVNLLALTCRHDGRLPPADDIAFALRVSRKQVAAWLYGLTEAGLLDRHGDSYEPHNWASRQFKSDVSAERVRRHRERHRNAACNVTETPSESETETETETEKKPAAAVAREDRALTAWQEGAQRHGWRQVEFMTSSRRFRLGAVLDQFGGPDGWDRVLAKAAEAKFFRDDAGGWHGWFSLDWLLDGDRIARLLEGAYAERRKVEASASNREDWNTRRIREARKAVGL